MAAGVDADSPPGAAAAGPSAGTDATPPSPAPMAVSEAAAGPSDDASAADAALAPDQRRARVLLTSVLIVATCGLVYELITATMASYLLGDSVTQFSLVIGVYLSAMGLGSYLSKFVRGPVADRFVQAQLVIAVVGGTSAPALFFGFAALGSVRPLLFGILIVVGTLVGLEIPLLMRMLARGTTLEDLVARVLAFDYIGALAASLLFPLVLLPTLGLVRTSLLFGLLNALVALWTMHTFRGELRAFGWLRAQGLVVAAALAAGLAFGKTIEEAGESGLYDAPVIYSTKSKYQRLTLTRWREDLRLFIDGNLQFSSLDEHRYHEALVHPAMSAAPRRARVLVLGGGDGLALREILKHPDVTSVDLVDLDPAMTTLFREQPLLTALNEGALTDPRVRLHHRDALLWLQEQQTAGVEPFDVAIVDLPDPNNFGLGKLYTRSFYRRLADVVAPDGAIVVQSTSPYLAPRSFWCIVRTLEAAGLHVAPYHAHVPSFGDWGYVLAAPSGPLVPPTRLRPVPLRFLDDASLAALFVFPADQAPLDVEVNLLNTQMLVQYYEADLAATTPAGSPAQRPGA
jgi:spermidine synthase